jgi:hypothetical protein
MVTFRELLPTLFKHDFTREVIDRVVNKKTIGNYLLGSDQGGEFVVSYVGRSDTDLNVELIQRLSPRYRKFRFTYARSVRTAFETECRDYHRYGKAHQLDNQKHPDRPDGTSYQCPFCDYLNR